MKQIPTIVNTIYYEFDPVSKQTESRTIEFYPTEEITAFELASVMPILLKEGYLVKGSLADIPGFKYIKIQD